MAVISRDLQHVLHKAIALANDRRHEYSTLEHLLLALSEDTQVIYALKACSVDIAWVKKELTDYIDSELIDLATTTLSTAKPTNGFQRVIQRALVHVQSAGKLEVTTTNVLVALFNERESTAVSILEEQNVSRFDVVNYLTNHESGFDENSNSDDDINTDADENSQREKIDNSSKVLKKYCINLSEEAIKGELDPVIGRDNEINRAVQVLCRRRKHNPLFVGESGVGKTAVAEGIAQFITSKNAPPIISGAELYRLDMAKVLAGTRYRGDFEERVTEIVDALKTRKNAIVFIDEIHTVVGSGSTSGGAMDMANLLKPALQNGEFRCMGATTHEEYRKHFEKDRALARRFQKIDISEPSVELTIKILNGLKSRLEDHHDVQFTNAALQDAAKLSQKYIKDRFLPDKAIDVLDETGAFFRVNSRGRNENSSKRKRVVSSDVEKTVATIARVPLHTILQSEGAKLESLAGDLRRLIFGQDQAVNVVTDAIKQSRAGLRDPVKPIGSYLFCGPTGVGKTEVARQLANCLQVKLVRFDMSEYMEAHSVARLIGAPPGYVGHDSGGLLTEAVLKNPHCVLLLDEIEKAHSDIYNILLQVMDYGALTDSSGRSVAFQSAIIVMTSNVGAANIARRPIGFTGSRHSSESHEAVEKAFSPEFRNRLDAVVPFSPLGLPDIEQVVDKMMMELEGQLSEKNVQIYIDKPAKTWMAQHGFDSQLGARPLSRLIDNHVKKPLSEELLFGKVKNGGAVKIRLNESDNKLELTAEPKDSIRKNKKAKSQTVSGKKQRKIKKTVSS